MDNSPFASEKQLQQYLKKVQIYAEEFGDKDLDKRYKSTNPDYALFIAAYKIYLQLKAQAIKKAIEPSTSLENSRLGM